MSSPCLFHLVISGSIISTNSPDGPIAKKTLNESLSEINCSISVVFIPLLTRTSRSFFAEFEMNAIQLNPLSSRKLKSFTTERSCLRKTVHEILLNGERNSRIAPSESHSISRKPKFFQKSALFRTLLVFTTNLLNRNEPLSEYTPASTPNEERKPLGTLSNKGNMKPSASFI